MVTNMLRLEKSLFVIFTFIFVVGGNIPNKEPTNSVTETSKIKSEIEDSLPEELSGGIKNLFELPEINEGEGMLQAKCLKNGGNESFTTALAARDNFQQCVAGLVDITALKKEINAAKPTGDLDTVFKKYCRKTPTLKGCIQDLLDGTANCLADTEQTQMTVFQNITDSLMNFICYKEGDRIALFIAEGGPECLTNKMESIQNCVNSTMTSAQANLNSKNISTDEIPEIAFDSEKCGYFTQVQKCVVQVLEDCSEPTPANIIGSLFDFVRKSTPCINYVKTSGSNALVFSAMSFLVPLGAILLRKLNL
uniref:27 kDa hemolymph protein n=1 Tax=Riptortus pedestris TaxID=329032 RepID=R4WPP9_RIPPE|nr:conserved hypothetical protein [Riptortus pedestris]